ncbi:putative DDE superfamily endonuclease [Monocercomonoides exilis]|uniref:putative DDE superfamily endonuclease n=1 Tax=Monocercomonoides exilis TaxID=2049356 RepID=UPI00355A720C|nr:putative DDE superfamily endonuclease [Monocercomonoides exilis]|eukprot:MONOS_14026.1-p1 / transcript=MONOS_14026.1 / gene=MONOS_14026 / organism=Monocercomonoides_exilis_PA203 / gene_product=unspecified product / transcript_product=unspecified product / location=Mono_scaffold00924:4960-6557(+) / protein_length=514 / sequence_SO=supercontig / SO=protein_coding / is_pseudo=false
MSAVKQRKEIGLTKLRDLMKSFEYRQIKNRLVRIATIIADGKCRVTDAANLNEFSRSSINRAVTAVEKGRTVGKVGRPELFTKEDKEVITGVIRIESMTGVSYSLTQTKILMESVLTDRKIRGGEEEDQEVKISKSTPYSFVKRNPDLKTSIPHNVDIQRLSVSNKQSLQPFFSLLQSLHDSHKYSPSLIFNTDESSLRLSDTTKQLAVHPSDVPVGFSKTPINMPNSTLVVAVAADGYSLPSLVLWPSKKLPQEMKVLLSPQLHAWADNDGWMTDALFARYAEEILLPGIVERRKLLDMNEDRCLLLLDSHPSRAQPDLWQKFADESIDVVTFIPHSTHLTQPLDCGVFAVFKRCFNSNYVVPSSSSIALRRKAVANALPQALQTALLPSTIHSAFEKSGVLSGQSNSVLMKLPDTPSVQLKKKSHRFNFHGKNISDQAFLDEWKECKKMKEEKNIDDSAEEKIEKDLFSEEKPKKRKLSKSQILKDDDLEDDNERRNTRKIIKRELMDYIYY